MNSAMATAFSLIMSQGGVGSTMPGHDSAKHGHFGTVIYEPKKIGNVPVRSVPVAEPGSYINLKKFKNKREE